MCSEHAVMVSLFEKFTGLHVVVAAATELQLELGRAAIERLLMSRIYSHAMFPNADGDIHRDQ